MMGMNDRKRQTMRHNPTHSTRRRRGFTLLELMVVIAIMAILTTIATLVFRSATNSAILAQAHNTLGAYARLARSYAIANQIETMMVVNPYNGRIELWHANPPKSGGDWSPNSIYDGASGPGPANPVAWADGFAFAPVFDSGAKLPVDGSGRPRVAVHPIDFYDYANNVALRPTVADAAERNIDNLTWAALCFDPNGSLVTRTRRVATRSFLTRAGSTRSFPNRLPDGQPDLKIPVDPNLPPGRRFIVYAGVDGDSPITSTHGFILSDAERMRQRLGDNPQPLDLVNEWLRYTIAPAQGDSTAALQANVSDAADVMVFNRFSGQEVARVE